MPNRTPAMSKRPLTAVENPGQVYQDLGPAERFLLVWDITLSAWSFREPNLAQQRLQRTVVRVVRGQG